MALLQLLRLPGVFTAFADVLAGYLIVRFAGAGEGNVRNLPLLLCASGCLYLCGMVWNDIFDLSEDRRLRPERPLPSGRIDLTKAFFLAVALSVGGLFFAMTAGRLPFETAGALLCAILFYDAGGKRLEGLGPLAMGACRGFNLFLGMSAHPQALLLIEAPAVHVPVLLLAGYTAILTVVATMETPDLLPKESAAVDSRMETVMEVDGAAPSAPAPAAPARRASPLVLGLGTAGLLLAPASCLLILPAHPVALGVFSLLLLGLAVRIGDVWWRGTCDSVRRLVGASVIGIALLDAGLVASVAPTLPRTVRGVLLELPGREALSAIVFVAAFALPAWALRRRIAIA